MTLSKFPFLEVMRRNSIPTEHLFKYDEEKKAILRRIDRFLRLPLDYREEMAQLGIEHMDLLVLNSTYLDLGVRTVETKHSREKENAE